MKISLSHLPTGKRDELRAVVEIINDMIETEFIILFGSYARGDWVEDRYLGDDGITYEYESDYDLLIVVKDLRKYEYKGYRDRIKRKARNSEHCDTRLSIMLISVDEFKNALREGYYFFTDIKKEGIQLYSSKKYRLPTPRKLSPQERKTRAEENLKNWSESAKGFYKQHKYAVKDNNLNIAAFELHQATERFYHTTLLVFTDYKPKIHDLEDLGQRVNKFNGRFKTVFLKNTQKEKDLFDLLKRAYTEARYNMKYKITKDQLEYLAKRVKKLEKLTDKVCREKIATFV